MTSVLFGSIGTIADTSELQRAAFNEAFKQHGLDWEWSQDEYRDLLTGSGGSQRVADYAAARGESVDADAVHQTKSELFQAKLRESDLSPRDGVVETIEAGRADGAKVALITTTSRENIEALAAAVGPAVDLESFDLITDLTEVDARKPHPAVYAYALQQLGEQATDSVAIEDNVGGVESAEAAGVKVVAFPNENTAGHDFGTADARADSVSYAQLTGLIR